MSNIDCCLLMIVNFRPTHTYISAIIQVRNTMERFFIFDLFLIFFSV